MLASGKLWKIVNHICSIPECRRLGIQHVGNRTNPHRPGQLIATLSIGENTPIWDVILDDGQVTLIDLKSKQPYKVAFDENGNLSSDSVTTIKQLAYSAAITVYAVLVSIINTDGINAKPLEYYSIYPNITDFRDESGKWNIVFEVDDDTVVSMADASKNPDLMTRLSDVRRMKVDVVGTKTVHTTDGTTAPVTQPLYRIMISDGVLAVVRYLNRPGLNEDENGLVDAAKIENSDDNARYSKVVTRINIRQATSVPPSDPHSLYSVLSTTIADNWKQDDNAAAVHEINRLDSVMLGSLDALKNKRCIVYRMNDMKHDTTAPVIGLALDDYLNCYSLKNLNMNYKVSEPMPNILRVQYMSAAASNELDSGVIAQFDVRYDSTYVVNKSDLNDRSNVFLVSKDAYNQAKVTFLYNTMNAGVESLGKISLNRAFQLVYSMITLWAVVTDISQAALYITHDVLKSTKSTSDLNMVSVIKEMEVDAVSSPVAHAVLQSRTNSVKIPINCSLGQNSQIGYSVVCTVNGIYSNAQSGKLRQFVYNKNIAVPKGSVPKWSQNTILEDCKQFFDLVVPPPPQQPQSPDQVCRAHPVLGMFLGKLILQYFTENVMADRRGRTIEGDNQQTKVSEAFRFNPGSDVGSRLLKIRRALIKTFGPGVIGTPENPSKMTSYFNTSEYVTSISKNNEGDRVATLGSFNIAQGYGGTFTVRRDEGENGEVSYKAVCNFNHVEKEITLNGDKELSDEFLLWYLDRCAPFNLVASSLKRVITNDELIGEPTNKQKTRFTYMLSPRVIELMANDRAWNNKKEEELYKYVYGIATGSTADDEVKDPFSLTQADSEVPEEERGKLLAEYDKESAAEDAEYKAWREQQDDLEEREEEARKKFYSPKQKAARAEETPKKAEEPSEKEEAPAETDAADNDDLFGGDGDAEGFDDEILDDEIEL